MTRTIALAAAALAALAAGAAHAADTRSIAIRNAGFEEVSIGDGQYTEDAVAGWTARGALAAYTGTLNPTAAMAPAVPTGNVAFVNAFNRGNGYVSGGFYQDTAEAIAAGMLYTLNVDVLRRADSVESGPIRLGRFAVQLMSNFEVLASGTFTDDELAPGAVRNLQVQFLADRTFAGPLQVGFTSITDPSANGEIRQAMFDNVSLSAAPMPEPATWATMIGGLGAVGATMRRGRRRRAAAAAA